MLKQFDDMFGEVISALKSRGLYENTLIVLQSGGHGAEFSSYSIPLTCTQNQTTAGPLGRVLGATHFHIVGENHLHGKVVFGSQLLLVEEHSHLHCVELPFRDPRIRLIG